MDTTLAFRLDRRGAVRVAGPDAAGFLDTLLTCRAAEVRDGAARYGALLTPQGKIIAELFVHADDDGLVLDAPADAVADLIKRLGLYKLRAKVTIEDAAADLAVVQDFAGDGDPRGPGFGARRLVPAAEAAGLSEDGYDAERIARGLPEQGADYGAQEVFPADVNLDLLAGVDFAKGCFVGQEVVSRMKRRGSVRKRTLLVEAASPLTPGAAVTAGAATLGEVTSVAENLGLARVRLDRLASAEAAPAVDGAEVRVRFPDWFPDAARIAGAEA